LRPSDVVVEFVEVVELSSIELEDDVKEGAQLSKHIMNDEELEEGEKITILPLGGEPTPTHDPLVFEESSPIDIEVNVEICSTLPPCCDMKSGEELEEVGEEVVECEELCQEEEVEVEEACQEVEVVKKEHKRVDLTLSKCGEFPFLSHHRPTQHSSG